MHFLQNINDLQTNELNNIEVFPLFMSTAPERRNKAKANAAGTPQWRSDGDSLDDGDPYVRHMVKGSHWVQPEGGTTL